MTSLTQLNESAASPIEVTDARPATVIFDRFATRDDIFTVSALNRLLVPQMGINEIVNYSTANVRYRLTINSTRAAFITASSLTFVGMPTGVSVATSTSTYAKQYTVTGLKSAKQFDQIKTPTWNIPNDYAISNTWWVKSEIIYYDQALGQDVTRSWYVFDPRYYYFAQLTSAATVGVTLGRIKRFAAAVTARFEFNSDAPYKRFKATITSSTLVTANGRKARLLTANATIIAGVSIAPNRKANGATTMTAVVTMPRAIIGISNVRPLSRIDMNAIFGPIGPAGVPYLEGNGFPWLPDAPGGNPGYFPAGWPGIVRIRFASAALSASGGELAIVEKLKRTSANLSSAFTMPSVNLEYRKGVGITNIFSAATVSASAKVTYGQRSTMSVVATVYAKGAGPERAEAALVSSSNVTAQLSRNRLASGSLSAVSSLSAIGQLFAPMIITVNVPANAPTGQRLVMFGFSGSTAVNIEWGDGTSSNLTGTFPFNNTSGFIGHTYSASSSSRDFQIKINGLNYPSASVTGFQVPIYSGSYEPKYRIKSIDTFGGLGIVNLDFAFLACQNLQSVPASLPSTITSLNNTFSNIGATDITTRLSNIAYWDTSNVTNMLQMFLFTTYFNVNINSWNTSSVTNMQAMFANCYNFNQPLNSWNTSNVTTMAQMFNGAKVFNQPLNSWNTAKVTSMTDMFNGALVFDQNISSWSVPLIPSKPSGFDTGTPATWTTAEKPNWGV